MQPSAETVPTPSGESVIELIEVSKDYPSEAGTVHALRSANLRILAGEFVAIVGTSGSGKSTMMNILGCLDRPTTGVYRLSGIDVSLRTNDARAIVRNRLIGFIFQGFNLLPRTTALENVELPLQYRGVPRKERRLRATQALSSVGLGDRGHHTPNQLSGGQQQRVAIARALVTSPPLLLADEPTGNLDTRTSLEVLALLQELNRKVGITIVLVTHEHDIAACASRVITMRDGRIVSDVRSVSPHDAAQSLAALGQGEGGGLSDQDAEPASTKLQRPISRIPWPVYAGMLFGGTIGALVGVAYNTFILGSATALTWVAFGLLGEAFAGARALRKSSGRRPLLSECVRASGAYSAAWVVVGALLYMAMLPSDPAALPGWFVPTLPVFLLILVATLATSTLARTALLALAARATGGNG